MRTAQDVRFWSKVAKGTTDECWPWQGYTVKGYGYFSLGGYAKVRAHRYSYEQLVGPILEGLEIDHLCRVPVCVNPAHLEAVTHRENVLRGNSPSALASKVTHCPQGHPYDEVNTLFRTLGWRECRICRRGRRREWWQRRKEKLVA